MNVVDVSHISKSYGDKVAVADLSFSIESGGMFGLLGPNGAGKSSSIRMLIGITMPDSGTVKLFGEPFQRTQLNRIGFLPEERGLYKKMNVLQQIIFFGELRGLSAEEAERRAKAWAEKLEITEALPKKTDELSKGMQQKIQFICTLIHDPDLIIMDEPFSGLDPVNATLLENTLLEQRRAGKAILFSTHRMDQVEKLCDHICLIHRGRAVLQGGMREIKGRYPRNHMVVDFEGDSGFLHDPEIAVAIEDARVYSGHAEIKVRTGVDAQPLVAAIAQRARVHRIEIVEPSLEEIFIQTVGGERVDA